MFNDEINPFIETYLKTLDKSKISKIIRYATIGGKCIRGFIVKHIIEEIGCCNTRDIWAPITAIELIHAASLIIDDLPCMDNDFERRGKPSAFIQFGKQEAILSALFIISESMRIVFNMLEQYKTTSSNTASSNTMSSKTGILIREWCDLLGKNLIVGQFMDLKGDVGELFNIKQSYHRNDNLIKFKTGSLFSFAFLLGALFTKRDNIDDFKEMGIHLGYMYQIMDDYKDKETDEKSANYILSLGEKKAVKKYLDSKLRLVLLLQKNSLYTKQFQKLIHAIDSKFSPLSKGNNQLYSYT